jgi:redox-sensitive bicupin YhaK (pirin superfamily)
MNQIRRIERILRSQPTVEGAGVRLKRAFGFSEVPALDPFLLLDDFHSKDPADYLSGFPYHPHRGIETITYLLQGEVAHEDSLGNSGLIGPGDVQWMTAGSGIIHQEMPWGDEMGRLWGFQLWANLPASHKMMAPRYQGIEREQIPEVTLDGGATVRVIAGEVAGTRGPVEGIVTDPTYLDVTLPAGAQLVHAVEPDHTVVAYVIEGRGSFSEEGGTPIGPETVVLLGPGERVSVSTHDGTVRFLLMSGRPLREPVAWRGPIVMNMQEELRTAFEEYRRGTFIKDQPGQAKRR